MNHLLEEAIWQLVEAAGVETAGRPSDQIFDAVEYAVEVLKSRSKTSNGNELIKRIAMLEAERGPGMKAPQAVVTCDIGAYWE